MYKLYLNEGIRTLIDVSPNEKDIIDTMGEYIASNHESRFIVIFSQEYGDCIYGVINGYKGYMECLERYNEKQKENKPKVYKKKIK